VNSTAATCVWPSHVGSVEFTARIDHPALAVQNLSPAVGHGQRPSQASNEPVEVPPVRLGTGDVVVNRGPAPYTIGDDPAATRPRAVIYPGQNCVTLDGKPLHQR
jgi:hypothetical protein